jgi:hypothetical protein
VFDAATDAIKEQFKHPPFPLNADPDKKLIFA